MPMRTHFSPIAISVLALSWAAPMVRPARGQSSSTQGPVKITLDEAIQRALEHNHNLLATRTTIQQSEAAETTANLRPNPVLLGDAQFLPLFNWNQLNPEYIGNSAQFDLGVSYLFERGKKRQHRLQAARDQTVVARSSVNDNERTLSFQVASQFIDVQLAESALDLAEQNLQGFQSTVDISRERYRTGDISKDDFLKIALQLVQFQMDESQARLARAQGLSRSAAAARL